jgi:hypothetical protein
MEYINGISALEDIGVLNPTIFINILTGQPLKTTGYDGLNPLDFQLPKDLLATLWRRIRF